jgi:hypothetical protein
MRMRIQYLVNHGRYSLPPPIDLEAVSYRLRSVLCTTATRSVVTTIFAFFGVVPSLGGFFLYFKEWVKFLLSHSHSFIPSLIINHSLFIFFIYSNVEWACCKVEVFI